MKTRANLIRNIATLQVRAVRRDPVRLTALLYLREALQDQRYEECGDIIAIAREFGAAENEIRNLLEDPRRVPA